MQVVTGKIVSGKVVLDGATLPDGTAVTVFARERPQADDIRRPPPEGGEQSGRATFAHEAETIVRLSPELQAELEAALLEADLQDGATAGEFLERLKQHG